MKTIIVLLFSTLLVVACSKNRSDNKQVSQTAVVPDNSGRNVRDRDDQNKTTGISPRTRQTGRSPKT